MGLLDRIFSGQGPDYKRPLLELDGVVGAWTAARTGLGGVALTGGEVVLARDHLVFSPWDMDDTRAFLVKWLGKAGVPHVGTADKLLTASKLLEPVVLPVADIARVEVLHRGSLFKPPQVRIHLRTGRHFDLGILHSPTTPNLSPKNKAALDDFLSKVGTPAG
jgi:hypothetical protein